MVKMGVVAMTQRNVRAPHRIQARDDQGPVWRRVEEVVYFVGFESVRLFWYKVGAKVVPVMVPEGGQQMPQ